MRSAFAYAVGSLVACLALPVRAERLAVVPLAVSGEVPAAEVGAIDEAIAAQLRALGDEVLGPSEARAGIEAHSPGCLTAERHVSCMGMALEQMGWETFVSGRVSRERPGAETRIFLEAYRSRSGEQIVAKSRVATAPDRSAVLELARAIAGDVSGTLAAAHRQARLSVESEPTGASVWLGGRLLGRTPWSGELSPGHVFLRIELRRHLPKTREITLEPGGHHELSVALEEVRAAAPAPRVPRARAGWQLPLGVGGLIAGAGLVALGVYGMTIEDCTERFPDGPCSERRTGTVWGGAALGAGVLVVAAGVITAFVLQLGPDSGDSNESD